MASRWVTFAAVCGLALGLGTASGQPNPAPPTGGRGDPRVGVSTNTVWLPRAEGFDYLRRARASGITWIREDFTWSTLQPTPTRFDWRRTDALMLNAAQLGIHVLAVATYAPPWASGHTDSNKYPGDAKAYGRFVGAIADRYGAGGTFWRLHRHLFPVPLTAIELWNEPWLTSFWLSGPDPVAYARLARAAATAVKARHPRISIIASGDVPEESEGVGRDWFKSVLAADPALWRSRLVDAWSVHVYCHFFSPWESTEPQRARFDRLLLTRDFAHQIGADKPVWITEFGWRTDLGSSRDAVSEQTQADYIVQALTRVSTEWRSFVVRSFVFTFTKPSAAEADVYNLVRPDGSPRPAWQGIQSFIATTK